MRQLLSSPAQTRPSCLPALAVLRPAFSIVRLTGTDPTAPWLHAAPCLPQKPFVEIKAGMVNKSEREGGTKMFLSADQRRGLLQLIRDAEGMMHLQWKDRRTNAVGFDLSVFPDEWEYALVKQCDVPRIIRMRFKQGVVTKDHFFWIQVRRCFSCRDASRRAAGRCPGATLRHSN